MIRREQPGPLYQSVLDAAQARRESGSRIGSMRRLERVAKFVQSIERPRWVRQGGRITWL